MGEVLWPVQSWRSDLDDLWIYDVYPHLLTLPFLPTTHLDACIYLSYSQVCICTLPLPIHTHMCIHLTALCSYIYLSICAHWWSTHTYMQYTVLTLHNISYTKCTLRVSEHSHCVNLHNTLHVHTHAHSWFIAGPVWLVFLWKSWCSEFVHPQHRLFWNSVEVLQMLNVQWSVSLARTFYSRDE